MISTTSLLKEWQDHIINQTEDPLPEAEEWAEITDKLQIKWDYNGYPVKDVSTFLR